MDNVSHSLAGLVLARAGLNRLTPHAAALLLLSANAPDIDIITLARSQFFYLEAHRGPTHALLAIPILAFVCLPLVAGIFRQTLPWFQAWIVCCIGVGSHLLLDWTNSYGIRPLIPFSNEWFHLDINALTDGPLVVVLAVALLWPMLSGLVAGEIGGRKKSTGQGFALAVLLLCGLFEGGRYYFHQQAVEQLQSRLYAGAPPVEVAALPTPINPLSWRGIVTTRQTFLDLNINNLGQLNTESARTFYRVPLTDITAHARQTPEFSYFLYFARFPIWSVQPVALRSGPGKRLELTDLRFGEPRIGAFHCVAVEDGDAKVLHTWFTFGSGDDLGWN